LILAVLAGVATLAARSATFNGALLAGAGACGVAGAALVAMLRPPSTRRGLFVAVLAFVGVALGGTLSVALTPAVAALAAGACAAVVGSMLAGDAGARRGPWPIVAAGTLVLGSALFVGATNPAAPWLGPVTSHGPTAGNRVALTFDDGPNGDATLAVVRILDEWGVKGAFFTVGKAVEQQPAVVQRIIADGHLVGNHSYSHDGWRFIQPGYPELARGGRSLKDATGICPRYYRPPHGTHTPFVWLAAERRSMRIVTWDVSTADWIATDAARLAHDTVTQARGGSIILLHDGIDGNPGADRQVLLDALPSIIDGLRARGLEPVRLDELLGEAGTRAVC